MAALWMWIGAKMIFGLLFPVAIIAAIVFGVRRLRSGSRGPGVEGQSVRRFFQYLILFGLLAVIATGFSSLGARLIDQSEVIYTDKSDLARSVSYIVVGLPLFVAIAVWTRRRLLKEPHEAKSFGWAMYFTLACITSLSYAMIAFHQVITWGIANGDYSSGAISQFIVWGTLWGAHWKIDSKFTPSANSRLHHIAGSVIGLITSIIGLVGLLSGVFERIFGMGSDSLFLAHSHQMLRSAITLLVGAPVWILYWIRTVSKSPKDNLWLAYALLVGVAGGIATAIVAASVMLFNVLVWFFGDPVSLDRSIHFRNSPTAIACVIVGGITWWYHKAVILRERSTQRNEVRRIYEYLMTGISLVASSVGIAIVIVSLTETFTRSSQIAGDANTNTLLLAATVLLVSTPVWWIYWTRIQGFASSNPVEERSSSTRRIYLYLVFGIGGIVAIITMLIGVYLFLNDLFNGNYGSETFYRMRIPFGMLFSTATVSGYHWSVFRLEHHLLANASRKSQHIVLLSPHKDGLIDEVARQVGAKVQLWICKSDGDDSVWTSENVVGALANVDDENVIVLGVDGKLKVIPFERG